MKIKIESSIEGDSDSGYCWYARVGVGLKKSQVPLPLLLRTPEPYDPENGAPREVELPVGGWAYRRKIVSVEGVYGTAREELIVRIKHAVLAEDKRFAHIRREVEAFENFDKSVAARRERIADSVKIFVWQRYEGKCVRCGSRERLEFDHIIPISLGGSSTERNIQLLCEACNRTKGSQI